MNLDTLNWNAVAAAIRYTDAKTPALLEFDYEAVAECVVKAAEHWAVRDAERYEVLAVEGKFEMPLTRGILKQRHYIISGVKDLVLRDWQTGVCLIVDWKTRSAQDFTTEWEDRYRRSWQGRIYALESGIKDLEYRGITRSGNIKTLSRTFSEDDSSAVMAQLSAVLLQIEALEPISIWPKHSPSACGAYGRQCPYRAQCDANKTQPAPLKVDRLSYTDMESFLTCPERFRLDELIGVPERDRSNANFGLAFHRGIAEVYNQIKAWQQGERSVA